MKVDNKTFCKNHLEKFYEWLKEHNINCMIKSNIAFDTLGICTSKGAVAEFYKPVGMKSPANFTISGADCNIRIPFTRFCVRYSEVEESTCLNIDFFDKKTFAGNIFFEAARKVE